MKHWDRRGGGKVVRLKVRGRDRRALYRRLGVETERESLSGTSVTVVLAMAVCAGLAWGLWPQANSASGPDRPILWGETQSVPQTTVDAADAEWAARADGLNDSPTTGSGRTADGG